MPVRLIFWGGLKIELGEPFERAAHLPSERKLPFVRYQKSSHEVQEAINRSTRFMRWPRSQQRTPSIPLNPSNEVP